METLSTLLGPRGYVVLRVAERGDGLLFSSNIAVWQCIDMLLQCVDTHEDTRAAVINLVKYIARAESKFHPFLDARIKDSTPILTQPIIKNAMKLSIQNHGSFPQPARFKIENTKVPSSIVILTSLAIKTARIIL